VSALTTGESRRHGVPRGVPVHGPARARAVALPRPVTERPPLRLVEPHARPRRLSVGLLSTMCLVAVVLGLFALAAMHSLVVQAQFELDRVDQSVADRRSQIEERRVQVAQAESPAAVVAAAELLGMVPATDRFYLVPEATSDDSPPAAP
jgi:hypothetical protein